MTKTRPSSTISTMPAFVADAASTARAEQESWSDSEDSMGYHVSYPNTATKSTSATKLLNAGSTMTTISVGGILTKIPANIAATKPFTVEPTMTTISIGGIRTKIPSNIAASMPITHDTTRSAAKEEHDRAKRQRSFHVQGCYSDPSSPVGADLKPATVNKAAFPIMPMTQSLINRGLWPSEEEVVMNGTQPVHQIPMKGEQGFITTEPWTPIMPITQCLINRDRWKSPDDEVVVAGTQPVQQVPVKGEQGFATHRPWTDEVAMVGYASTTTRRAKPTDESVNTASYYAISPAAVLSGVSADTEEVPPEATVQRYGRILHELPGEEKRKVRALMESIEEVFPSNARANTWYLSAIGALIGSGLPQYMGDLYLYLCAKPEYQTPTQRQVLVRRTREALFKCIPLNGIAVVTEAVAALAAVEAPHDQDHGTRWAGKQITPEKLDHARAAMEHLHGPDHVAKVYEASGSHKDLAWINENIVYGLFFADHSILSVEETELVILPAFVSTGLKGPAEEHLKAALRLGMKVEEVEQIHRICEMLAGWKGTMVTRMKRAADLSMSGEALNVTRQAN